MLFLAFRDPERNVAVVDGMTVGLCILAVTPLISLYTLDVERLYPGYLIWARSLIRLALAGVLYYLRPRGTHLKPAGNFLSKYRTFRLFRRFRELLNDLENRFELSVVFLLHLC